MTLQQKLSEMKQQAAKRLPADTLSEMLAATDELRDSGIMNGVIKVGNLLPGFELKNQEGKAISSEKLLTKEKLVIVVFRGHW